MNTTPKRTGLGIGLAFVIGVLAFFITFQAVSLWRGPREEPLIPVDKRQAGEFQARYFQSPDNDPEKTWSLRDQAGKVVVVNLFATWCGPCMQELPDLKALAREYGARGVVFVSMSLDQDGERGSLTRDQALARFVQDELPPFPILVPTRDSILWKTQQIPIPQTFLYDKHGKNARIVEGSITHANLKASLEELLKEP